MSDIVKRRHRWPWAILAVLLLLAGGPIAWRFRPLNAAETALVGEWRPELGVDRHEFLFTSDRRFTHRLQDKVVFSGWWEANGEELSIWNEGPPTWRTVPATLIRILQGDAGDCYLKTRGVHFYSPDQVAFSEAEVDGHYPTGAFLNNWERIPGR